MLRHQLVVALPITGIEVKVQRVRAQAFVLAGAELAVGTIAPVEDDEARRFGRALAEVSPDAEAWARVVRTFPDYRVFTR